MDPRTDWMIRKYMQVCAGIRERQEWREMWQEMPAICIWHLKRGEETTQRVEVWTGEPQPQEGEEGQRQDEGPQAQQAVQEVKIGEAAFRPPLNVMRVGKSLWDTRLLVEEYCELSCIYARVGRVGRVYMHMPGIYPLFFYALHRIAAASNVPLFSQ